MARKLRVHYNEAVYHVIARGNNKQIVFKNERDKHEYLMLIEKYKLKFGYEIYAYVLMNNHLHLLIKIHENPLAKIMQGIQLTYTKYFNWKYGTTGHVFEQRYKAMLCKDSNHLLTLIKYIHNNPVKAKLSESLVYNWSSHRYYLNGDNSMVNVETPLSIIDDNRAQALSKYLELMYARDPEVNLEDVNGEHNNISPETSKLTGSLEDQYEKDIGFENLQDRFNINVSMEELIAAVTSILQIRRDLVCSGTRQRDVVKARNIIIYLALENDIISRRRLEELFNISNSMITRACQGVSADRSVPAILGQVERALKAE